MKNRLFYRPNGFVFCRFELYLFGGNLFFQGFVHGFAEFGPAFPDSVQNGVDFGKVVDSLQFSNRLMCVRDVAQRSAILNWLMCNSARHRIITSRNANRIIAESSIDIKWYQKVTQNPATN